MWSAGWMTVWPQLKNPARVAASLLRSQEQVCVRYSYVTSSSYLARSCEYWNSFSAPARDPGVATERLFRGRRKGRTPSTTLSTATVRARTSVQRGHTWREAESSMFGKLSSRF